MMTDFEYVRLEIDALAEKAVLCRASRVAGEQHSEPPVLQDECNRIVVDCVFSANEGKRWADERQRHAIIGTPNRASARIDDRHTVCVRGVEAIVIGMSAVRLPAIGDFRNT